MAWCFVAAHWALPDSVAAAECGTPVARAVSVQGVVETAPAGAPHWIALAQGDPVCPGDRVRLGANSRAALYLDNDTFLRLGSLTTVAFPPTTEPASAWLEVLRGIAHFMSRVKNAFEVYTPYVNAAIEGTEFSVQVTQGQTQVSVLEGRVRAHNAQGTVSLADGQVAIAAADQIPVMRTLVRPQHAVQWTLYYPPLLVFDAAAVSKPNPSGWAAKLARSVAAYRRGDLAQAFAAVADLDAVEDIRLYTYRAALNLRVGQVDRARIDLDRALALQADDADALALTSLIATTQNDPQAALRLARQAVTANPQSAGAQLALSYAWQARGALKRARAAGQAAVKAAPDNALAWSRLAELRLMFRDLPAALQAAQRATDLDPLNAQTQTTLGFAQLIRLDSSAAQASFERAGALDEAAPLPRLGLGLALIHRGQLAAGRHQIEIAANLDPLNALIRSYLGKAYYEEKRNAQAGVQFELAKTFDPHDPTAWFYDAIMKQTENRPVAALDDLQTSIALNDNRAVYRSRLLLDQDEAARDANLARIYTDLGFEQLALNESRKSLSADPGNHSAHRFLADAYRGVPRHEIARVSERLQSQLLQPAAVAPVSPSDGEARLLAFEGTGASTAGFNEFNPLFSRRHLSVLASGVVGSNDTRSGEIAAGAFSGRGMFSVGRFKERSDGVQRNGDSDQSVDNVYTQYQLTPSLGIQGEYRNRNSAFGDLAQRMSGIVTDERRNIDRNSWRIGMNYSPSPRHTFLGSVIRQDLSDVVTQNTITLDTENSGPQYEVQYLYRGGRLRTVAGVRYLDLNQQVTTRFSFFGMPFSSTENLDVEQRTAYLYTHLPWSDGEVVLGVDYEDIHERNGVIVDKVNPKLGVSWNPDTYTTIRFAAIGTTGSALANNQTIAPTQVVGVNQVFDDRLGSTAWRYGVGLDHKMSRDFSIGAEVSWRTVSDLRIESTNPATVFVTESRDEQAHKAYIYWTPNSTLAISAEYQLDYFKRDFVPGNTNSDRPAKTTTHSLPFGIAVFLPAGFYTRFISSYINQEVANIAATVGTESLNDSSWISNLSIGYRLPKKLGLIEFNAFNIFDRDFQYQSTEPGTGAPLTSPYYPERAAFLNMQLWL